jgi:hypothetical protein
MCCAVLPCRLVLQCNAWQGAQQAHAVALFGVRRLLICMVYVQHRLQVAGVHACASLMHAVACTDTCELHSCGAQHSPSVCSLLQVPSRRVCS